MIVFYIVILCNIGKHMIVFYIVILCNNRETYNCILHSSDVLYPHVEHLL